MAKEPTLAEVIAFFDSLKEFMASREDTETTELKAQIGDLKHRVEKIEALWMSKKIGNSCQHDEQPALEWEVWAKQSTVRGNKGCFCCTCDNIDSARLIKGFYEDWRPTVDYEVRHNPKRK